MNKKGLLFGIMCGIGGGMVGFFAGKLDSTFGIIMFSAGVALPAFGASKISR